MPNPLPFARKKLQRLARRLNSPALRSELRKGDSVTMNDAGSEEPLAEWIFVPQEARPEERGAVPAVAAELLQLPPLGTVASSLTTTDAGTVGVSVSLTRSVFTDSETSPFGVTGQEQQETNCSSGENV